MNPENQNFEQMKKALEDIIILQIFTINDSHMIWFFRYGVQQTKFFVIFDHFLPLHPPNNPNNQNFEKLKKNPWRYHHFTQVYQKSRSYAILFRRYGTWRM